MTVEVFAFFFLSLAICYLAVRKSPVIQNIMAGFADHLQIRAFPSTSDFEHIKFAFLRIIFGGLLLNRAVQIWIYLLPEEYSTAVGICAMAGIVSAVFIMIGFLTQWAFLFSMFYMWQAGESVTATSTLGNDIAASVSLLLALTSSGKFLSVDGCLISWFKDKKWNALFLYDEGIPSRRMIALAKFASLFAYFLVCVFSLCVHFNESAWMTGVAGPYLLTNNFMSAWHEWFINLFAQSSTAVVVAKYALWIMMVWYPTLIPFTLLGGVFRSYTIYWGFLFLCMSSFELNLGSLAEFEFVFWAGLFWAKTGLDPKKKLSVFYDDTCNLCDRTVLAITILDIFNRVTLRPLSKHSEALQAYGVTHEAAMENLYGVQEETRTMKFGYDFYVMLAKNLFLLWPVLPFLYLGKVLFIGPMIYALVAKKRHAMFGVCKLPTKKVIREEVVSANALPVFGTAIVAHVLLLGLCYAAAIPMPYIHINGIPNYGATAAAIYGIAPINVFNRDDLRMAENWFTLRDIKNDKNVPLFAKDGTRLRMHRSDRIYFGHTLLYRRSIIGMEGCAFHDLQAKINYLAKVYLHSIDAPEGDYPFEYVQYRQPLPDDDKVLNGEFVVQPVTNPCTEQFVVNYKP